MSKGIDAAAVTEDLFFYNEIAEEYAYGTDEDNSVVFVQHYNDEGQIIGTQAITITVGEFKAPE